jgi:hypothetical protein
MLQNILGTKQGLDVWCHATASRNRLLQIRLLVGGSIFQYLPASSPSVPFPLSRAPSVYCSVPGVIIKNGCLVPWLDYYWYMLI